jgi:hypothetical protein
LRTIVHIGQHKTGTTSIQAYLKDTRNNLINQGLYIPDSILEYNNNSHFILNVYSLNPDRFSSMKENLLKTKSKEYFDQLEENLKKDIFDHYWTANNLKCKEIIWSNEGLYLLNSIEEYKRLYELFRKHSSEVVCICCFRDVEEYKVSYTKQLNKQDIML